jgi:MYXO-CTERM domain-containing protein
MTSPWARIGLSSLTGLAMAMASLTAYAAAGTSLVVDGNAANTCPDGGTAITRGCRYGGEKTFDKITVRNGGVIEVASFLTDKTTTGNLVLKSLSTIDVDVTSRITAKGAGYQGELCNNGPGPAGFPFAGGRGGCSVRDSGGGGAHYGRGGKGTKDCFTYPGPTGVDVTCTFPNEWEEACGTKVTAMNGTISCSSDATQPGGLTCYGSTTPLTGSGDALPDVSGQSFYHNIFDIEFGAAGGDKGCRDNNGFGATDLRAGDGGGRIVLFAANAAKNGAVNIFGRVTADGFRGCSEGNDSAGAGAGGTVLIIGDTVNVYQTARVSARGGRGGDSQPKGLACTYGGAWTYPQQGSCPSGQLCRQLADPASGAVYARCDPSNCVPVRVSPNNDGTVVKCSPGYSARNFGGGLGEVCVPAATDPVALAYQVCGADNDCVDAGECSSPGGCDCMNFLGTVGQRCVPKNQAICDYLDFGENEAECAGTQNSGTCDDCAGGGGGGIINVQSRVNNIDPRSIFDVRGGAGGICPICAGEAGAGAGELQIDAAYVGEICDGKDNDFNGAADDGLAPIACPDGSMIAACTAGKPNTCPTVAACNGAVTDTRPRFALVVDTSGSMLLDNDGEPRFGDGSVDFPGINGTETRLYNAKGALTDVLAAFPESDYALARYYQDSGLNRSCQTANWFECAQSCCSYDDPSTHASLLPHDNVSPAYPYYYPDSQCVPSKLYGSGSSSDDSLASLNTNINIGWQTPTADCINYSGSCGPPKRGAQYLVDFSQPLSNYLSWLDNKETSFKPGVTCPSGDCELRATGPTPLASSLQATLDFLAPRIACDNAVPCRKYNVILLTDGAESCQGDPGAAAKALNDGILKTINGVPTLISVKTYVIGFSTLPAETAELNNIAAKGGTTQAYFVTSRAQLANAMATIISGSFVFEKCNGKDDDCDGQIDEDFPETQPPTGPGLVCDDGQLGKCKGTGHFICKADGSGSFCSIDNPGGASGTEVCNGIDDNCNGFVDESTVQNPLNCEACVPQPEICDGFDNDCDKQVDEVADLVDDNQPCGSDVGQCDPGVTVCVNGDLQCQGFTGPFTETCDGFDNDCDNVIDGMSMFCYVPAGSVNTDPEGYKFGECRSGISKCTAAVNSGTASWGVCAGQKLPTVEVCDGKDNDCNGVIDDVGSGPTAVGAACCDPKVKLPALCGTGQCNQGKYACVGTQVTCVDAGKPSEEACDSIDNDCNDAVDDIKTLGDACTTLGGCPGKLTCDLNSKAPLCVPDGATKLEVCNGVDDDCDGSIDEENDVNENDDRINVVCDAVVAPNDRAPCMSGHTVCRQGGVDCVGAVHPLKEVCDLKDNDCDGVSDTLAACPGGNACIEGQCDEPCRSGEFPCPSGFECKPYEGKRYCVPRNCVDERCPEGAHCRNNKCTLDGTGAGGEGNTPGNGEGGEASQAGAPSSEGGQGNGMGGDGIEPNAGEPSTNAGTSGSTGAGAQSNEGGSSRGAFGLVTGGGGCACRTTPARGGHAALAASLLLLGALFSRRRRGGQGRAA